MAFSKIALIILIALFAASAASAQGEQKEPVPPQNATSDGSQVREWASGVDAFGHGSGEAMAI
jgi:hypothetical protein